MFICCGQDVAVGLSWREETELRKALYASMQKQKQHREKDDPPTDGVLPVDTGGLFCMRTEILWYFAAVTLSHEIELIGQVADWIAD